MKQLVCFLIQTAVGSSFGEKRRHEADLRVCTKVIYVGSGYFVCLF